MLGVAVHSRKTLGQGLEVLQGLPQANAATVVLSALVAGSILIGILFLAWVFKLGFLADFLAHTVLVGFLTGVGFQVGIAMLHQ